MVENQLCKALRVFLKDVVKDFALPAKANDPTGKPVLKKINIFNGFLPPKRSGANDDFPFIVVRADAGTSNRESTEVNVSIIVGTYSEDFDGHEYCMNVLSRIRAALCALPGSGLANKYLLQYPIKWNGYADQPYPYWQFDMQTTWLIRTPDPLGDDL